MPRSTPCYFSTIKLFRSLWNNDHCLLSVLRGVDLVYYTYILEWKSVVHVYRSPIQPGCLYRRRFRKVFKKTWNLVTLTFYRQADYDHFWRVSKQSIVGNFFDWLSAGFSRGRFWVSERWLLYYIDSNLPRLLVIIIDFRIQITLLIVRW